MAQEIDRATDAVFNVGCGFLGILGLICLVSGAWTGIPILGVAGIIWAFSMDLFNFILERLARPFGYDPDKKSEAQLKHKAAMDAIRAEVSVRNHCRRVLEAETRLKENSYEVNNVERTTEYDSESPSHQETAGMPH